MKTVAFAAIAALTFAFATVGVPTENAGVFATPQAHAKFGSRIKRAAKKVGRGIKRSGKKVVTAGRKAKAKIKKFGQTKAGRVLKKVGKVAAFVAPVPGGRLIATVKAAKAVAKGVRAGMKLAKAARTARAARRLDKAARTSKVAEIRRLGQIARIKRNRAIGKNVLKVAKGIKGGRTIVKNGKEFRDIVTE